MASVDMYFEPQVWIKNLEGRKDESYVSFLKHMYPMLDESEIQNFAYYKSLWGFEVDTFQGFEEINGKLHVRLDYGHGQEKSIELINITREELEKLISEADKEKDKAFKYAVEVTENYLSDKKGE